MKRKPGLSGWLIAAGLCVLAGFALLLTPLRFSGALLTGIGVLLALWGALKKRPALRRVIAALVLTGFVVFSAAEIQVIRYAYRTDDSPVSAVIVLGAGVYGTEPSLSLKVRLDAALDYIADKPDVPVVVSGGQGSGEDISEAQCMADYLIARGVNPDRILLEDRSTSTKENLTFSAALLCSDGIDTTDNIAVVSADYHLYRAACYWGLPTMVPVSAAMPRRWWPITVNYFIREALGVIYLRAFGI